MIATLQDAQAYFDGRLYAERWFSASHLRTGDKTSQEVALEWANQIIETSVVDWFDSAFVATSDESGEPLFVDAVKRAVYEEALYLLSIDPTEYPEILTLGVKTTEGTTFDKDFTAPLIAPISRKTLEKYAVLTADKPSGASVRSASLGY